jgi:hypothetical protein
MSLISLAAAEKTRDLPADPIVIGLIAFVILLTLMAALLMFGKGRPHS